MKVNVFKWPLLKVKDIDGSLCGLLVLAALRGGQRLLPCCSFLFHGREHDVLNEDEQIHFPMAKKIAFRGEIHYCQFT